MLSDRYIHAYTPMEGIGSLVEAEKIIGGTSYYQYPIYDHRGTVYKIVDDEGDTVASYAYNAFGQLLDDTEPAAGNRFKYQTNWMALKEGLYLSPSNVYDSTTGRFIQRDPLAKIKARGKLGVYQKSIFAREFSTLKRKLDKNSFAYVANNPINLTDRFGLEYTDWEGDWLWDWFCNYIFGAGAGNFLTPYALPSNFDGVARFFFHFVFGAGSPVDLKDWGLLGNYQSASQVKAFLVVVASEILHRARRHLGCSGSITGDVNAADGLFIMGEGYLNASWQCRRRTCLIEYSINDKFEDPTDLIEHINLWFNWHLPPYAGNFIGITFPITASWTEYYTLPENVCCPK